MSFDKDAYWAKRGQKREKGRACQRVVCGVCKSADGTLEKGVFKCNNLAIHGAINPKDKAIPAVLRRPIFLAPSSGTNSETAKNFPSSS